MKIYWHLFCSFFKIGLFTFGGGYAMLPLIQKEVVNRGWADEDEILDYYAIGQVTPGIIAVNVSTFIGYKTRGWLGAICAMTGIVLPSLIIITTLAMGLSFIWEQPIVGHAFAGIRLVIPALLAPILLQMVRKSVIDKMTLAILLGAFILSFFQLCSPICIVVIAAVAGLLFKTIQKRRAK